MTEPLKSDIPQEPDVKTFKVIEKMTENLEELDSLVKTLEKESDACRNVCAGLTGAVRQIDGAIRGKK
jgi:hypothetical protein